jgi:hypothetical protein
VHGEFKNAEAISDSPCTPCPTPSQYETFKIVLALAAAGVAAFVPGFLQVQVSGLVRAGGAIAVFVLIFMRTPAQIVAQNDQACAPKPAVSAPNTGAPNAGESSAAKTSPFGECKYLMFEPFPNQGGRPLASVFQIRVDDFPFKQFSRELGDTIAVLAGYMKVSSIKMTLGYGRSFDEKEGTIKSSTGVATISGSTFFSVRPGGRDNSTADFIVVPADEESFKRFVARTDITFLDYGCRDSGVRFVWGNKK